jgi:hypothetical protein
MHTVDIRYFAQDYDSILKEVCSVASHLIIMRALPQYFI